jgi:hypothetical protein
MESAVGPSARDTNPTCWVTGMKSAHKKRPRLVEPALREPGSLQYGRDDSDPAPTPTPAATTSTINSSTGRRILWRWKRVWNRAKTKNIAREYQHHHQGHYTRNDSHDSSKVSGFQSKIIADKNTNKRQEKEPS